MSTSVSCLYVGNLPVSATSNELSRVHSQIIEAHIMDRRRYGFVFLDTENAEEVIGSQLILHGNVLVVREHCRLSKLPSRSDIENSDKFQLSPATEWVYRAIKFRPGAKAKDSTELKDSPESKESPELNDCPESGSSSGSEVRFSAEVGAECKLEDQLMDMEGREVDGDQLCSGEQAEYKELNTWTYDGLCDDTDWTLPKLLQAVGTKCRHVSKPADSHEASGVLNGNQSVVRLTNEDPRDQECFTPLEDAGLGSVLVKSPQKKSLESSPATGVDPRVQALSQDEESDDRPRDSVSPELASANKQLYRLISPPSHTLILEGIDGVLTNNKHLLISLLSYFGKVGRVDAITVDTPRVYAEFDSPSEAMYAAKELHMCTIGASVVSTKLA